MGERGVSSTLGVLFPSAMLGSLVTFGVLYTGSETGRPLKSGMLHDRDGGANPDRLGNGCGD
jgi:hypothetical protein